MPNGAPIPRSSDRTKGIVRHRVLRARLRPARPVRAPKIGERAVAYRLRATVSEQSVQLRVYMDVLAFQRGRTQAVFIFTGVGAPLPSQLSYARIVDARLR